MHDIAVEAGVSKGLVSLILRGAPGPGAESAARVLAIAERLGYRVNRAASLLARRHSGQLGVTMTPTNPFHGELVEHLQRVAGGHGYEIAVAAVTASHPERRAIETLLDLRCEGLVLLAPDLPGRALSELVAGVPAVSVGRPLDEPGIDVVRAADRHGLRLLVEHLTGLGHRRLVHLDGGRTHTSRERRAGYRAAMAAAGLPPLTEPGGWTEHDGIAGARTVLLRHPDVSAIVAYNDRAAVGVLEHLDRIGVAVPGVLSVTGFDDSVVAQLTRISLTTVSQEAAEQAELAVAGILERLDGSRVRHTERVLDPSLVVRSTTGPAR